MHFSTDYKLENFILNTNQSENWRSIRSNVRGVFRYD